MCSPSGIHLALFLPYKALMDILLDRKTKESTYAWPAR
jgi:hypothetical protein